MSDRAILFLFSVAVIVAALGVSAWLFATGQLGSMDGLFLFTACLVLLVVFGLYARFLYRRMADSLAPEPARPAAAQARGTATAEGASARSEVNA